ncbi:hypothetical protein ABT256_01565 [Amycolatopsis japonica]|uniref:hypothetical protein n=1 Tax=Amycolatopsis japonica TaxID=208439 RepID=UPI0033305915
MSQIHSPHVGLIIEGFGDRGAIPLLLRNYLHSRGIYSDILGKPIPLKGKSSATKDKGIEGYAAAAASRPGCKGLLVVLDADDEMPCKEGPELLQRVATITPVPCVIAIAERDYEDWIYASAETLEIDIAEFSPAARGLKEITNALRPEKYRKPIWQPKLTARIDFDLARSRSSSFNRFLARFDELCQPIVD